MCLVYPAKPRRLGQLPVFKAGKTAQKRLKKSHLPGFSRGESRNSAVDTNLLLYAHNSSGHSTLGSQRLCRNPEFWLSEKKSLVVCHQTLCEFFAALTNSILLPNPSPTEQAWGVCRIYLDHPLIQKIAYEPASLKVIESLLRDGPQRASASLISNWRPHSGIIMWEDSIPATRSIFRL